MKSHRLLLALLALAPAAFAQTDPAKLALAHDTVVAMGADKVIIGTALQMQKMAAQMSPTPSGATSAQRADAEALEGKVTDLVTASAKGAIAKMAQIYADFYSEAELKALKAFYTSPEGRSMQAKQPQIITKSIPMVQEMQRELTTKIKQLIAEAKAAK